MNYLKKYNLTEEDINEITEFIDDMDYKELIFNQDNVENLINYFIEIGIINIKDILKYKTNIFYDDINSIKNIFNSCDKNIINLINEDINNFDLLGI